MSSRVHLPLFSLVLIAAPGCRHTAPPPDILPLNKLRAETEPRATGRPPNIPFNLPQFRAPDIDVAWLDADEFIPPGATVIYRRPEKPNLSATPRAKYPSTEECIAIDANAVVGTTSDKSQREVTHRLLLYRRGDAKSRTVFHTANHFEVLWSPDSEYIAITEYVGRNSSEVLLVNRKDALPERIDLAPLLARYFRPGLLDAPRFQKAYRWSNGPLLLVRVLGRLPVAPYEQFGCEVLVDVRKVTDGTEAEMELVSAFTKVPMPMESSRAVRGGRSTRS